MGKRRQRGKKGRPQLAGSASGAPTRRPPQHTSRTPAQPSPPPVPERAPGARIRRAAERSVAYFLALLGALGALAAILAVETRFSLGTGELLIDAEVLSVPIHVTYEGYIPLRNVRTECTVLKAYTPTTEVRNTTIAAREIGHVEPSDVFTTGCAARQSRPPISLTQVTTAELELRLEYQFPLLWTHHARKYRFGTERDSNGRLRWMIIGEKDR